MPILINIDSLKTSTNINCKMFIKNAAKNAVVAILNMKIFFLFKYLAIKRKTEIIKKFNPNFKKLLLSK